MAARAIADLGGETQPDRARRRCPPPAPRPNPAGDRAHTRGDADAMRWATRSPPARPTATPWSHSARRDPTVVALDGEVSNSTHADEFAKAYPDRFFEMFIAEQQMVAAAVGLSVRGYMPFASTFAAFLTRAHDFIRMAAISQADIVWSVRTPASRSAPTVPPRWRWRTWR